jgi:hypothetical protein
MFSSGQKNHIRTNTVKVLVPKLWIRLTTIISIGYILKGSDDGEMHFEESCFRTLSIVQCFYFKNDVSEAGPASVFR